MRTSVLSPREKQVLTFASYGLRNSEIAERLDLSEHTVKNFSSHMSVTFTNMLDCWIGR